MASKLSEFKNAEVDKIVAELSVDEATSLITGVGNWYTAAVPRLGIPSLKTSDGPNGVRGSKYFNGTSSKCLPCATALAATWDTDLIGEAAGTILASEARLKATSILLGPTVNIQRSPLGGRSFESFSEDPHLSGTMAAFYIAKLQENGISACIKHFVCNDQEHERHGSDSIVSERALREIYLYPFMLAQKYGRPWSVMTAYNRLNGLHCSENPKLLTDILRKEWGFDGMVMSDWRGVYSVADSIYAGLDLEMPALDGWRAATKINRSINAQKLTADAVKARAAKVVQLVKRASAGAPEIIDGDKVERSSDTPAERALMRKIANSAIVLLKNDGNVLPIRTDKIKKIAIIGPNAKASFIAGGGSASLKATYIVSAYDGIVDALPKGVEVVYAEGCQAHKRVPTLEREIMTENGSPGWTGTFHVLENDGQLSSAVETVTLTETDMLLNDSDIAFQPKPWYFIMKGKLRPRDHDATFQFGLSVAGRAKLFIDDKLVIDNWTRQRRGESFFGDGTEEESGVAYLKAGVAHDIKVEYCVLNGPADGDEDEARNSHAGVRLGGFEVRDEAEAIDEAAKLAQSADAVVVVVGLNADWESEGYDRKSLELPRRTNELVERVAQANLKTVVVTQAGSAFTMPWVHTVPGLLHAWYLGNETGNAIADVLFGKVNPSGKLSLTFPKRLQDVPAYLSYGSENGKVRYNEGLFVGYRHYQSRDIKPLFPFGHGLSYTTFTYSSVEVSKPSSSGADFTATVKVSITNSGDVTGSEAVQLYISPPPCHLTRPAFALKAFSKIRDLPPGKEAKVELTLDKLAVSYFDDAKGKWRADKGEYGVHIGSSSADLKLKGVLVLDEGFTWSGL